MIKTLNYACGHLNGRPHVWPAHMTPHAYNYLNLNDIQCVRLIMRAVNFRTFQLVVFIAYFNGRSVPPKGGALRSHA